MVLLHKVKEKYNQAKWSHWNVGILRDSRVWKKRSFQPKRKSFWSHLKPKSDTKRGTNFVVFCGLSWTATKKRESEDQLFWSCWSWDFIRHTYLAPARGHMKEKSEELLWSILKSCKTGQCFFFSLWLWRNNLEWSVALLAHFEAQFLHLNTCLHQRGSSGTSCTGSCNSAWLQLKRWKPWMIRCYR